MYGEYMYMYNSGDSNDLSLDVCHFFLFAFGPANIATGGVSYHMVPTGLYHPTESVYLLLLNAQVCYIAAVEDVVLIYYLSLIIPGMESIQ